MSFGSVTRIGLALLAGLAFAVPACATDDDVRSVTGMMGHNRILLVFAPTLGDGRLAQQRRIFAHMGAEAAGRDLVLVQVADGTVIGAHDKSDKLRQKFGVAETRYRAMLLGKDGTVVIDRGGLIEESTIRATIDAMPMRQAEMRGERHN